MFEFSALRGGILFWRGECKVLGSQVSQTRSLLPRSATVSDMQPHSLAFGFQPKVIRRNMMTRSRVGCGKGVMDFTDTSG